MIYLMCDLTSLGVLSDDVIGVYGRSHDLPHELVAVSRGLWALDNQKYKDKKFDHEMKLLVTNLNEPLFPWQHHSVCSTLLSANEIPLALLYSHHYGNQMQTAEEVKVRVAILVRGNRLNEACRLLTQYEGSEDFNELFNSFLDSCFNAKNLHKILQFQFDSHQEELLVNYLDSHLNLVVKEMAVFYFLSRHDYIKALKVHKRLKPLAKSHPDPQAMQRYSQRELLLDGFNSVIPTPLHEVMERDRGDMTSGGGGVTIRVEADSTLSSVVAKEIHSGRVGTQAGVIYDSLQAITRKRDRDAEPLTPFKRVGEKQGHAPFLSTPVSIKKSRAKRHDSTRLFTPTPKRSVSMTPGVSATPAASDQMKLFYEHMKSFKEKMTVLNETRDTTPDVLTPLSTPKSSSYLAPSSLQTASTPASILKVKDPEAEVSKATGSETKKIRFAMEGSPQVTPFLDKSTRRLPSSFTPAQPSSLAISASVTATQTPLPSSDDSDLFQSPLQSPSDLNDATTVTSLSTSMSSSPPSLSLSSASGGGDGASVTSHGEAFKTALEEASVEMAEESEPAEKDKEEDKEEEMKTKFVQTPKLFDRKSTKDGRETEINVQVQTTPKLFERVTPSFASTSGDSGATNSTQQVKKSTPLSTASPASPAVKELLSQLTRKTISSSARSTRVTPGLRGTRSSIKSTPSVTTTGVGASTTVTTAAATTGTSSFFSPIPMLDDLIAAKHRKLKKTLDESKKLELSRITAGLSGEQPKTLFSTTMVQQVKTTSDEAVSTPVKQRATYNFSPAETLAESSHPPTEETDPVSFVFSPPLTRSAARRLRSGRETSTTRSSVEKQSEEETPVTQPKKRGRGRPRKSVSSTPERSLPDSDTVQLVSPPSHEATPTLIPRRPRPPTGRKTRTAKSGVGTRRSTRLLMTGKK